MVSLTFVFITALLTTMSFARTIGFSAPTTVHAGETINAVLIVENYIRSWTGFGVIWGLQPKDWTSEKNDLGSIISYNDTYSQNQVQSGNMIFSVPIPIMPSKEYILTAAIPYLTGAAASANITYFQQKITIVE